MKIAICFSGQIRTGVTCAPNILRYIGDLRPNCDFFVHTWDIETQSWYNKTQLPVQTPYLLKDKKIFSDFYACYQPLSMVVEPYYLSRKVSTLWSSFRVNPDNNRNVYAMFESIYEANRLKKLHEDKHKFKYDIVVRIRPDLIFHKDKSLKEDMGLIEHDRMFITANHLGMWGEKALEDIFWIGNSYVMDQLANFVEVRQNSKFEGGPHDPGYKDWNSHQAAWVHQGLGFAYKSCLNNNMRIYYRIDEQNKMDVLDPPFGPEPTFGARPEEIIQGHQQTPYDPWQHLILDNNAELLKNNTVEAAPPPTSDMQAGPKTIGHGKITII
jgi:hypothetical protein